MEVEIGQLEFEISELKFEIKEATSASKRKFKPSVELKARKKILEKQSSKFDEINDEHNDAEQELSDLNEYLPNFIAYEAAEKSYSAAETKLVVEMKRLKIKNEDELEEILEIDDEKLGAEVTVFRDRVKAINAILTQPDFKKLPDGSSLQSKIDELTAKIETLDEQLGEINDQLAVVERITESLKLAKSGINSSLNRTEKLREEGDPYLKLKDWVEGTNSAGLSLTNFVLQERLEMILEYASRHLRRMSNGKYEFRLYEDRQGRTKKAGLGITIMDYFAGKERPAETLSGGETFYASLALALGLVEVVKADNGGIELGTLFIDEGFGSLSDDTLEEVLDVLEDLREERVIGIISHVEGMKTQIPMRLEVRPTEAGPSTVKMAIASIG
jgi:exonuclease SbcC